MLLKKILKNLFHFFEEKPDGIKCPECYGKKTVIIHRRPDRTPDPLDTIVPCPVCHGTGYVPEHTEKKEHL